MRHEHERRKAKDYRREAFRQVLAGLEEAQLLCLEAQLVRQVDKNNAFGQYEEADYKIELLSDLDDRLLYLERFNFKNITKLAKETEL